MKQGYVLLGWQISLHFPWERPFGISLGISLTVVLVALCRLCRAGAWLPCVTWTICFSSPLPPPRLEPLGLPLAVGQEGASLPSAPLRLNQQLGRACRQGLAPSSWATFPLPQEAAVLILSSVLEWLWNNHIPFLACSFGFLSISIHGCVWQWRCYWTVEAAKGNQSPGRTRDFIGMWSHSSANVLTSTELYILKQLKRWFFCYANFISI